MNKSGLAEVLSKRSGITQKRAEDIIEQVIDVMSDTLAKGERIEIRGFGAFAVKEYKGYTGRNPKSRTSIQVLPKRLPYFKVGKELRKRVDFKS